MAESLEDIGHRLEENTELPGNCFVLCVDGRRGYDYYFAGFFRRTGEGNVELLLKAPYVHLGMFQDGVLCHNELAGQETYFDLRYFPRHEGIELYHALWDMGRMEKPEKEQLRSIRYVVCNIGEVPLWVNGVQLAHMEWYSVNG